MYKVNGFFTFLQGSSYEVGLKQSEIFKNNPELLRFFLSKEPVVNDKEFDEMKTQLEIYCPGINEELNGFCDGLKISPQYLNYYRSTLVKVGCSHGVVLPKKAKDNKIYVFRNYDLTPAMDGMRLCSTNIEGKYSHTGFEISLFGRSEGMNEKGLCVTFSACGMPVGDFPGMRKPKASGLQFWAIVRALLEQCKDVEEAMTMIRDMPIASNMNLIIADALGNSALVETFDGRKAFKKSTIEDEHLIATNHPLFSEIMAIENKKINHSCIRYDLIQDFLNNNEQVSKEDIKALMKKEYPRGLTVHNYKEAFGTLRSMLFDLKDKTIEFSYGSPITNSEYKIKVGEALPFHQIEVTIEENNYSPDFWRLV